MSAGQGLNIADTATAVLDGVVEHFQASEVELPECRFIAAGAAELIAPECEMVTVSLAGVQWGTAPGSAAGARRTSAPVAVTVRYVIIAVQIIRCIPEHRPGDPASTSELTESGLILLRDAGLLSQALTELCGPSGALVRAGAAVPGEVEPIGPLGAMAGVDGRISITAMKLS